MSPVTRRSAPSPRASSIEIGARKPDPAGIICALEYLGVPAERAVFVGDSQADADAAAAAGVRFIGVGPLGTSGDIRATISTAIPELRTALEAPPSP